jgi:hypothetical protein
VKSGLIKNKGRHAGQVLVEIAVGYLHSLYKKSHCPGDPFFIWRTPTHRKLSHQRTYLNYLQREPRLIQNKVYWCVLPLVSRLFSNCRYIEVNFELNRLGSVEDIKRTVMLYLILTLSPLKLGLYQDNPLETRFLDTINFAGIRIPPVVSELFKSFSGS